MFCPKCGKSIDNDAKFCANCGVALNEQTDSTEAIESTGTASSSTSIKKKSNKILIITIIAVLIVGIVGIELFDNINHKKADDNIKSVQNSYFEFLPEITVGKLLYEYYGEAYWIYDFDKKRVNFYGTNHEDNSGISIDFEFADGSTVSASYVMFHLETEKAHRIRNEEFEEYMLSLYHQLIESDETDADKADEIYETSVVTENISIQTAAVIETTAAIPETNQEKPTVSEDYLLYLSMLNSLNAYLTEEDINNALYYRYYLYDINHDGTYELLVHLGESEAEAAISVYTIDENGEMLELGEIPGGHIWLSEKDEKLYSNFGIRGYYVVNEIKVTSQNGIQSIIEETVKEEDGLSDYPTYGTAIAGISISDTSAVEALCPDEVLANKANVEAYAKTYSYSGYEGSEVHLFVSGDFSCITVQINSDYDDYGFLQETYTKEECGEYITFNFNAFANPQSYFVIIPFDTSGNMGDMVICDIPTNAEGTLSSGGLSYAVSDMKGQINCHGGVAAGFTTEYVVNGGAVGKVRASLGDKWHVTAKNVCINYGITWYELWDSDDGDYYGWVDANYIDFY